MTDIKDKNTKILLDFFSDSRKKVTPEIITILNNKNYYPNAQKRNGETILQVAIQENYRNSVIRRILSHPDILTSTAIESNIYKLIAENRYRILRYLILKEKELIQLYYYQKIKSYLNSCMLIQIKLFNDIEYIECLLLFLSVFEFNFSERNIPYYAKTMRNNPNSLKSLDCVSKLLNLNRNINSF